MLECKQEAVWLVHGGSGQDVGHGGAIAVHWVQAERQGKLTGADSKVVHAEQMEAADASRCCHPVLASESLFPVALPCTSPHRRIESVLQALSRPGGKNKFQCSGAR